MVYSCLLRLSDCHLPLQFQIAGCVKDALQRSAQLALRRARGVLPVAARRPATAGSFQVGWKMATKGYQICEDM